MKLPEHYEKWMEEEFPESSFTSTGLVVEGMRLGAHRMYAKLMEDFSPAIEALKVALSYMDRTAISPTGVVELATVEAALRRLKERGLVE